MIAGGGSTVLVGASTLAGREVASRLAGAKIATGRLVLVDPESEVASVAPVGDDLLVSTPDLADALDGASSVVSCVPLAPEAAALLRTAAERGAVVLDLSGTLGGSIIDAWSAQSSPSPGLHALPCATSILIVALGRAARAAGARGTMVATCVEPVSELGREALDELFAQSLAMLNFTEMPMTILGRRLVHDVQSARDAAAVEARVRAEAASLLGEPAPALVVLRAGVFHGASVALRADVAPDAWRAAIVAAGRLEPEEDDREASPASAARAERAVLGRVADDGAGGAVAFAAADSLAFGAVGGAVRLLAMVSS